MKFIKKPIIYLAMSMMLVTQTGCFGEFALVSKVYDFNDSPNSKFVKSVLFWVMYIVPIYGIAAFLDVIIFNLIEFWSGSNPIAMNEGDYEQQLVTMDGIDYKIEATKNTFTTTQLTGDMAGEVRVLKYDAKSKTWNYSDCKVADVPVVTLLDEKTGDIRIHNEAGFTDVTMADLRSNDLLMAKLGCEESVGLASAK